MYPISSSRNSTDKTPFGLISVFKQEVSSHCFNKYIGRLRWMIGNEGWTYRKFSTAVPWCLLRGWTKIKMHLHASLDVSNSHPAEEQKAMYSFGVVRSQTWLRISFSGSVLGLELCPELGKLPNLGFQRTTWGSLATRKLKMFLEPLHHFLTSWSDCDSIYLCKTT